MVPFFDILIYDNRHFSFSILFTFFFSHFLNTTTEFKNLSEKINIRIYQILQCAVVAEIIRAKQHRHEGEQIHEAKHEVQKKKSIHINILSMIVSIPWGKDLLVISGSEQPDKIFGGKLTWKNCRIHFFKGPEHYI